MNKLNTIKSSFFKGAAFSAGALIFVSLSWLAAQTLNTFSAGDIVSAAKINENFLIAAPTGQISPFYLASCPAGWEPADGTNGTPDLRGRFIRGLDDAGTGAAGVDPSGVRTLGAEQFDAFQGHRHQNYYTGGQNLLSGGNAGFWHLQGTSTGNLVDASDPVADGTNGTPRTSSETRPRNVALIYCMRKDT